MSIASPPLPSPSPSRRDRLTASLRALISNDDIDPALFNFGGAMLGIDGIKNQQQACQNQDQPQDQAEAQPQPQPQPQLQTPIQTQPQCATPTSNCDSTRVSQALVFPEEDMNIDPALNAESAFTDIFTADQCGGWLGELDDAINYNSSDSLLAALLFSNESAAPATPYSSSNGYFSQPFESSSCNWDMPLGLSDSQPLDNDNNNNTLFSLPSCENWASSSNNGLEDQRGEQPLDVGDLSVGSIRSPHTEQTGRKAVKRSRVRTSNSDPQPRQSTSSSVTHRPQKPQRTHYVIEKRYRVGLNERFDALRDCVESWKRSQQQQQRASTSPPNSNQTGGGDDSSGVSKMNKAEVLIEAVTYFKQLQEENDVLLEHLKLLIRRLRATKLALHQDEPVMGSV